MNNQPIINIGCLGCVSDGKSTLIEKLTGTKTQRHSSEKDRNITIKQGYGNMKIWLETDSTEYYTTNSSYTNFSNNSKPTELVNHISFVDCPGHQDLIQTLFSSISLMDGAIIVIAVNQPLNKKNQIIQHLIASKINKLDKIIICLNKIDLISKNTLLARKKELDDILEKYDIKPFIIIPTCFNKKIGLQNVIHAIMKLFNPNNYINKNNLNTLFRISRSFDINKPGTNWDNMKGGVLGGCLIKGELKIGDEIEIRPGYINTDENGQIIHTSLKTKIISLKSETNDLDIVIPGGLIGIGTNLDPFYCKNDILAGNILVLINSIEPCIYNEINIQIDINNIYYEEVWKPQNKQTIILQIGNSTCSAVIIKILDNNIKVKLDQPMCIPSNQNIMICNNKNGLIKLIGSGILRFE
jgi:small GTP-binding protein